MERQENVVTHTYDLLKYLVPQLLKFPRTQKFVLADRIQNQVTEVLGMLIEAYYTSGSTKKTVLKRVNIELEKLRYYVRLAYDIRCFNMKKYEYVQGRINEIGSQVGAWIKSIK